MTQWNNSACKNSDMNILYSSHMSTPGRLTALPAKSQINEPSGDLRSRHSMSALYKCPEGAL